MCERVVCDKAVCKRLCVKEMCVKELCVCVTKLCVKELCVTKCRQVPQPPRKVKVDVAKRHSCYSNSRGDNGAKRGPSAPPEPACHKCHTCHAECTSISPSTKLATQSKGRCREMPRLPRRMDVDGAKRHTCHANSRGLHGVNWDPSAPPEPAQCHKRHACHAK